MTKKSSDSEPAYERAPRKAAPRREAAREAKRAANGQAAGAASPYHHGALHDALLEAAERVLERDGLAGLTLRAVAREAGVSHAAPTHHFGDLTGLVSELAAIGFRQFSAAMAAAGASRRSPMEKALARAHAYVGYAQAHPGMYGLMFRTERLDMSRPSLHEAANASFAGFAGAIGASRHEPISAQALSLDQGAAHRAGVVAGARFHHAAARRPALRHTAAAARGHQRRNPAGRHAQIHRRPAAGAVIECRKCVLWNRSCSSARTSWGRFATNARKT